MSDPKTAAKPAVKNDDVVIPPKVTTPSAGLAPASNPSKAASSTDTRTMSSVGAELHPDAAVKKVDGKVTLDAGGSHPAAAPQPTPAEAVLYPSTGGLPDTGPNSKYVLGTDAGPELYNRDGDRVNADGRLIDDLGNTVDIPEKGVDESRRVTDKNLMRQERFVTASTKEEMAAGKRALNNR